MIKSRSISDSISHSVSVIIKKAIIILILIIASFKFSWAQDTIVKRSGVTISCKIERVDSLNIYFSTILENRTLIHTYISLESVTDYKYGPKIKKTNFWFNGGVGACIVNGGYGGNAGDNTGPSFGISFTAQKGKELVSIRYVFNEEIVFLKIKPLETVWDFGALYGRIARTSFGFASIAGGLSCIGGVRRGSFINLGDYSFNYEKQSFISFGIPLESQLFLTPSPFISFGIYGFANLNPEKSFFGALFCIQLGRFK
jgi:hypothetical protein